MLIIASIIISIACNIKRLLVNPQMYVLQCGNNVLEVQAGESG